MTAATNALTQFTANYMARTGRGPKIRMDWNLGNHHRSLAEAIDVAKEYGG